MPSFYVVAQYVPDPVADERINFGVLVFGEGRIYSRFLNEWRRVRQFGTQDIGFLQDFSKRVSRDTSGQLRLLAIDGDVPLTEENLSRLVGEWANAIQFTAPRASTPPAERLLERIWPKFLKEPPPRQKGLRTRRSAGAIAYRELSEGLRSKVGSAAGEYVKRDMQIAGALDFHDYDVALRNGSVYAAAQAVSFEVGTADDLNHEVSRVAWAIDDVRKFDPKVALAVVVLPPTKESHPFQRLTRIAQNFGAELVTETEVHEWAERLTRRFAKDVPLHTSHTKSAPE